MSNPAPLPRRAALALLVAAAAAATPAPARAASVLSQVFIGQGNGHFVDTEPFLQSTTFGQDVQASNTLTHNRPGGGQLAFQANVFASSTYQSLKSSTSATLSNSYYDPNYTFESNGTQTGVPTNYDTQSISRFTETLQYGGTAHNYTSRYYLHLSGNITRNGLPALDSQNFLQGPQVTVRLRHANAPAQVWSFTDEGPFSLPIVSSTYVHGATPQTFFLEIITGTQFRTEVLADGATVSGAANFGNTLDFLGVELRDADTGQLLPDGTITNDLGQPVPTVPEPTSAALLLLSACGLAAQRRHRAANH